MRYLLFPFRLLYFLYALSVFLAFMFLIIPGVVLASFFGKIRGGNMIYRLCCFWGDCWCFLVGIRHRNLYEAPHSRKDHFIFVSNHSSYMDAPIIVKTIRQPIRALGKVEMARVPVFGYIYREAIVTVDRSSAENRARSVRILKSVVNKGISIFIFPEGTFNTSDRPLKNFYDGAFRIAIETQTSIKPVLILDSNARLPRENILHLNPGRSRSVFLAPILVEGLTARDIGWLRDEVFRIMEEKLLEYRKKP